MYSEAQMATRAREIQTVAGRFGVKAIEQLAWPTMSLSSSSLPELVPQVMDVVQRHQPEIIYTVNRSDAHSDHRVSFQAVMACTKSFRAPFLRRVLMYECLSETEFAPALPESQFMANYWEDVTDFFEEKLAICALYASEMGEHPFPRSTETLRALATYRGAVAGVPLAEAFSVVKWINK